MTFANLNILPSILSALQTKGYKEPTPIQQQSIPPVLEGKDLLGTAQTGTGKTAAYAVPVLQLLSGRQPAGGRHAMRALILAPTRELAIQIRDSFTDFGRNLQLRCTAIYGGVSQVPQVSAVRGGLDILIATPGRLLDLMNQHIIHLDNIEILVLDEADRMLDMGFIHDVHRIVEKVPAKRQTLLFSATMPNEIAGLAASIMHEPVRVAVSPESPTVDTIRQSLYFVNKKNKRQLLLHMLRTGDDGSVLVFTRTKYGANKLSEFLSKSNVPSEAIHGNKSQSARQLALRHFKGRQTRVLVATDIAARGIDISRLAYVVNFDLPAEPETYIHRIGRTGRAGLSGTAVSFCDENEKDELRAIQKLIGQKIPVVEEHPFPLQPGMDAAPAENRGGRRGTPHPGNRGSSPRPARTENRGGRGRRPAARGASPIGETPRGTAHR